MGHNLNHFPNGRLTFNFPQRSHPPSAKLPKISPHSANCKNSSLNTEAGNTQPQGSPGSKQQLFEEAAKSTVLIHVVPPPPFTNAIWRRSRKFQQHGELGFADKTPRSGNETMEETWERISGGRWLPDWHKLWSRAPEGGFSLCHKGSNSSASIITKSRHFISSIKINVVLAVRPWVNWRFLANCQEKICRCAHLLSRLFSVWDATAQCTTDVLSIDMSTSDKNLTNNKKASSMLAALAGCTVFAWWQW